MTAPLLHPPQAEKRARVRRGGWSLHPDETVKLRTLSFGGGVQSTTLVEMMIAGELPWVDAIIYADTGDDGRRTLEHVADIESRVRRASNQVQFLRVSGPGRLSDRIRARASGGGSKKQDRFVTIPAFTANGGRGKRQCTRDFKVEPLEREQRRLLGFGPRQRIPAGSAEVWIGISTDELFRAGSAYSRWAINCYPLLGKRMSRMDCRRWLTEHGRPVPPSSACAQCPNRADADWRWLKENDPEAFAEAVEIDQLIRTTPGMKHEEYLHRSLKPLAEIDFSSADDRGQGSFLEICEAGCAL